MTVDISRYTVQYDAKGFSVTIVFQDSYGDEILRSRMHLRVALDLGRDLQQLVLGDAGNPDQ